MSKLYFRYGAMGAAKTLNLLAVAHNYRKQGKKVFLIKPLLDDRSGVYIASRAGLREIADFRPDSGSVIGSLVGYECVLVDEAQFLTPSQVDDLRAIASAGTPVICYGLRADFQSQLFPGSQRLLEVADTIEEIKTTCQFCDRKATQNLRLVASKEQVCIGGDEAYAPACWPCYVDKVQT